jgi:hypothetical protein
VVIAQGELVTVRVINHKSRPPSGGRRGVVRGFSPSARLRLLKLMNCLVWQGSKFRPKMLHLTQRDCPDHATAQRNLNAFWRCCKRKWGGVSCVWRLEFQDRGAIHFHLIVFGCPWCNMTWLQHTWNRIVGQAPGEPSTRVEGIRTKRGLIAYCAKYICKAAPGADGSEGAAALGAAAGDEGVGLTGLVNGAYPAVGTGRHWGVKGRPSLPLAEPRSVRLQWGPWYDKFMGVVRDQWEGAGWGGCSLFGIQHSEDWLSAALGCAGWRCLVWYDGTEGGKGLDLVGVCH